MSLTQNPIVIISFSLAMVIGSATTSGAISTDGTLSVTGKGDGAGNVKTNVGTVDCDIDAGVKNSSSICKSVYNVPSVVLRATPEAGSVFVGWSGCDSTSGNKCTVGIAPDTISPVIAEFALVSSISSRIEQQIGRTLQAQSTQFKSNQPKLFRLLQGGDGGFINADGSEGAGYANLGADFDGTAWTRFTGSWSSFGAAESRYGLATFGAHKEINDDVIFGGMLQFDYIKSEEGAASQTALGWMAGPYLVARHPTENVYFEGAALYGQSYNDINPFGTYEDSFATERWFLSAGVTGEIELPELSLFPLFNLTYSNDKQETYLDSTGTVINSQTYAMTEITAGLDFSMPLAVKRGDLNLTGGISAIYGDTSGSTFSASTDAEGARARLDLGISRKADSGLISSIGGFYDGIGISDYDVLGLNARFSKNF